MRFPLRPTLFIVMWTVLCGVGVAFLLERTMAPPHPLCRDMCGMGRAIGSYFIGVVVVVWLAVSLIAIWVWRRLR